MNRIYRRVWNRQLNALVVASELATGDSGGTAPRDRRASLLVPSTLALALLCVLASGPASATESSQSLRDLQALAAKYTQPMPVKVDAEVALAAAARQAQANPAISANARVGLQLSTTSLPIVRDVLPATVQVKLAAGATPRQVPAPALGADVRANIGVGNVAAARVGAAVVANVAPAAQAPLGLSANAAANANVGIAGTPVASVDGGAHVATAVSTSPTGLKAAVDGKVDSQLIVAGNHIEGQGQAGATASVTLPAKEELPGDTDDRAITAAFDTGVAGKVRVQGKDGGELVADRNLKLAGTATVAAQNSALGLGGLLNGVGTALNGVGSAVGSLLNGDLNGTVGNLTGAVGGLVGNTLGSLGLTSPSAIPPTSPKAPAAADPNAGLVIGTGGLVGGVTELLGPTTASLFGGTGYLSNGNLKLSTANVMQTYSTVNVLGLPVVNATPVGTTLNGLGGAVTGGSSHLTLIGGVTSDSYIYNINNGNPGGLLGLLLPKDSPAWAAKCLDIALADISCWAVNAAQDYQVLMGDGAYANGSKEVVIGANARHELPKVDANVAFPGAGANDPSDPTGVPTADYAARMGHSVVVGDSASGTANGQTLLGAESTSNQANSVALGYRSAALRGAQASYSSYGLTTAQVSAGEVSVGTAGGGERQITNLAAGSANTDAVNVAQLKGAISQIDAVGAAAVTYDLDGAGDPNYRRVTLGNGTGTTTIGNLAAGAINATSSEAINGAQLFAANQTVATHLGGGAAVDANGVVTAPTYTLNNVAANGTVSQGSYNDVGTAFDAVSNSLANVADQTDDLDTRAVKYDVDGSGNVVDTVTLNGTGGAPVKVTNVAAGSILAGSSDAITGDQLFSTHQTVASYFGGSTVYNGSTGLWTAPTFSISTIATDGTITGNDYSNVTAAFSAVDGSLRVLNQRISSGGGSPYLAVNSTAAAATATGAEALAVGPQASAAGAGSVAVGNGANASAGNSVALGAGSVASVGAQTGYTGAYGQTGASNSSGEVAVGSSGSERKITHVADGSDDHDATNVGQLKNGVNYAIDQSKAYTDQKIQNITNVAGSFRANNSNNLADPAATGANSAAGGAGSTAAGANSTALGNGSQAQADNSVALGAGSVANRANTVSVGAAGAERQVVNVADGSQATDAVNVRQLQASQQGTIRYDTTTNGTTNYNSVTLGSTSSGPTTVRNVAAGTAGTDAVNVDQLKSGMAQTLDWSKAYTDERMGGFERDLRKTDNRASAGIASAMATASLPQPSEAGRNMASIAAGSYNGESGVALGISGVSEGGRWIYKFSGSTNSRGEAGVAVGAGIQW
uniref:Hemagglutinin n=1 Tax=Knufia peltigerae TaxID=1002370 RepID=A0AA38XEA5_9EURO|nr:hypothetical protein H2204_015110 [Knufia peltigerae]